MEMEEDEIYEDAVSEEGGDEENKIRDISNYYAELIKNNDRKDENLMKVIEPVKE